jgi:hypothetical protein
MTIPDAVGVTGVAAFLTAYALLQISVLRVEDSRFAALNGFGSLAMLFSLYWNFNLASFISQVIWLILTVIGFVRYRR